MRSTLCVILCVVCLPQAMAQSAIAADCQALSAAIASVEGWNDPRSPVRRLHNPGALVYVGQAGAVRDSSGYARFETDEAGWSALRRDLAAKHHRGMSVEAILRVWAIDEGYVRLFDSDKRILPLLSSRARCSKQ